MNGSQGGLPVVRYGSSSSRIFSRHVTCVLSVKSQPVSKSTAYPGSNPNALHFSVNLGGENISVTSRAPNAFNSVSVESSTCDSTPMWNNDVGILLWILSPNFRLRYNWWPKLVVTECRTRCCWSWRGSLCWNSRGLRLDLCSTSGWKNQGLCTSFGFMEHIVQSLPCSLFTFAGLRFRFLSRLSSFHSFLVSFGASDRFSLGLSQGYWHSHFLSDLAILLLRLSPPSLFLLPVFSQHRPISFDLLRYLLIFPSACFCRSYCG